LLLLFSLIWSVKCRFNRKKRKCSHIWIILKVISLILTGRYFDALCIQWMHPSSSKHGPIGRFFSFLFRNGKSQAVAKPILFVTIRFGDWRACRGLCSKYKPCWKPTVYPNTMLCSSWLGNRKSQTNRWSAYPTIRIVFVVSRN
jgi:hypothetical protein